MKLGRTIVIAVLLCLATSCNIPSLDGTVSINQLTQSEADALDGLLTAIYKQELGRSVIAFYSTTYYQMPKEDGSPTLSGSGELDPPITVLSAACSEIVTFRDDTLKPRLKAAALSKGVRWTQDGKTQELEIVDAFVVIDEHGAGGTMYDRNIMVTIVPRRLKVKR